MNKKQKRIYVFSIFIVIISSVVLVVPEYSAAVLFLEVLGQYRLQTTFIAFIAFIFMLFAKHYLLSFIQLTIVLFSLFLIVSGYSYIDRSSKGRCDNSYNAVNLRVLSFNVYHLNTEYTAIMEVIEEVNPDIILLQEVKSGLHNAAHERIKVNYPFSDTDFERGIQQGKAIYSRYPIVKAERYDLGRATQKALHAQLDIQGQIIRVIGVHMISPQTLSRVALRNSEMMLLTAHIKQIQKKGAPIILAGDFNTAPWEKNIRRLKQETGLKNNAIYNIIPTWPSWLPVFMRVPIDHIYHTKEFSKRKYYKGLDAGSDHYPVYVDLEMCK